MDEKKKRWVAKPKWSSTDTVCEWWFCENKVEGKYFIEDLNFTGKRHEKPKHVSLLISPFYNFIVKTAFFIIHLWVLETSLISFYLRMRKKMILKKNVCPVDTFDFITCLSPQITLGFVININYCLGVFDTGNASTFVLLFCLVTCQWEK